MHCSRHIVGGEMLPKRVAIGGEHDCKVMDVAFMVALPRQVRRRRTVSSGDCATLFALHLERSDL